MKPVAQRSISAIAVAFGLLAVSSAASAGGRDDMGERSSYSASVDTSANSNADAPVPWDGRPRRNVLYLSAGGAGGFYSANYEYQPIRHLALRTGAGLIAAPDLDTMFVLPVGISALLGPQDWMFELGVGASHGSGFGTFPWVQAGVRYQPAKGGFFAKAGVTSFLYWEANYEGYPGTETSYTTRYFPWPELSLGGSF